ncbi:MAG: pyridoxal-phosphate dependent enzyme [Gemmatimonadetes bacterium]|nr:pyridoxal-phosphate dependent enzyme [Gemmatimonadota bacterium]MBI3568786.1 pyridoxal-phosphate dependent enzyme [Gemmatimonadota bacterium]
MTGLPLVTLDAALRAQAALGDRVRRTPMMASETLSALVGTELLLKLELFQKTGSFKARGALNRVDELSSAERARGVVTISAGNHAQAVAWAARAAGAKATVVMPTNAVRSKVEATKGYGGEVIQTDGDLLATALALKEERGLAMVHPFDDPAVIAGAATCGLELCEDVPDADVVLVGCGGGGILSGIAVAVRALNPRCRVIGVEPEGAPAMRLSLDRGSPQRLERIDTVADGLAAPFAGNLTFEHVRRLGLEIVTVTDAAIVEAMWLLIERCKVLAEPAAAAGLAALMSGVVTVTPGTRVVCVVTGGNADRHRLKALA